MAIMYRCYFFSIGTFFENVIGLSVTTIALCNLSNCLGNGGLFVVISHNIPLMQPVTLQFANQNLIRNIVSWCDT